jgi:hypothetical protein
LDSSVVVALKEPGKLKNGLKMGKKLTKVKKKKKKVTNDSQESVESSQKLNS